MQRNQGTNYDERKKRSAKEKSKKEETREWKRKLQTKFFELVNRTSMVSAVQENVCAGCSASRLICDSS